MLLLYSALSRYGTTGCCSCGGGGGGITGGGCGGVVGDCGNRSCMVGYDCGIGKFDQYGSVLIVAIFYHLFGNDFLCGSGEIGGCGEPGDASRLWWWWWL